MTKGERVFAPPRAGRWRALGGALLILAVLFGVLELAARLIPFDRLEPQFAGARETPLFVAGKGAHDGRMVTNDHFRGTLAWQSFARVKPPGTFRIFVLGGSAALGWPVGERNGFTGFLRRALDGVAPGAFEVVNVCGMSFGSHRVLDFLREIVERYEPDLVVVYSGNNEYVERNVLPAGDRVRVPAALRRSAIYRAVRLALFRAAPERFAAGSGSDLTDLRAAPVTRGSLGRTPAVDREVLENYRRNLAEEADTLVRRGVAGVFCTVPVNLADWPPEPSTPVLPDPRRLRQWHELLGEMRQGLLSRPPAPAVTAARAAFTLAPQDPTTLFWYAKTLQAAGSPGEALPAFLGARDRDPRVIRAIGVFNEAIRSLPASRRGIAVLDLEQAFADRSPGGIPGEGLFLDYVHPTGTGHRLAAELLAGAVARVSGRALPQEAIAARIAADPGPGTAGKDRSAVAYTLGMSHQQMGRLEDAERAYRAALAADPEFPEALLGVAAVRARLGDRVGAAAFYERALRASPENGQILMGFGFFLLAEGHTERADTLLRSLVARNPYYPAAHFCLGVIALRRGAHGEAADRFHRAAELGYESAELRSGWGEAALGLGRREEAVRQWERALALDPFDDDLRRRLASLTGEAP